MTYLESVLSRLPDSVFEALDSQKISIGTDKVGSETLVAYAGNDFNCSKVRLLEVVLDAVGYKVWLPQDLLVDSGHLLTICELVEEMNAIACGDFIEKASEGSYEQP